MHPPAPLQMSDVTKIQFRGRARPRVVVGVPVRNGSKYLSAALDSICACRNSDLGIYIRDNASTDDTHEICEAFANRDPRVAYERVPQNEGALANFRAVFSNTDSDYFMWAAHDDLWPHDFVDAAVDCLESDRLAVMANTITQLIDEKGQGLPLLTSRPQLIDLAETSYPARVFELARRVGWCIYGLIRRSALERTSLLRSESLTQDVLLTYELAALGTLRLVSTSSPFCYRIIPKSIDVVSANLGLEVSTNRGMVTTMFVECASAIRDAPVARSERAAALAAFVATCAEHSEWWGAIASESQDPEKVAMGDRLSFLADLTQ